MLPDVKQSVASSVFADPASFKSSISFSINRKCRLRLLLYSACRNSMAMSPEQTRPLDDSSGDGPASGCETQNSESSLSIAARKFLIARLAAASPEAARAPPDRFGSSPTASTRMPAKLREGPAPCKRKRPRTSAVRHRQLLLCQFSRDSVPARIRMKITARRLP